MRALVMVPAAAAATALVLAGGVWLGAHGWAPAWLAKAPAHGLTKQEVLTLPPAELAARVLGEAASHVTAASRPDGGSGPLALATTARGVMPGLCLTQMFVAEVASPAARPPDGGADVTRLTAYRVVGDLDDAGIHDWNDAAQAALTQRCARETKLFRFYPASDFTSAYVGARVIERLAHISSAAARAKLGCATAAACEADRNRLATLSPAGIQAVSEVDCPGPQGQPVMCLKIAALETDASGATKLSAPPDYAKQFGQNDIRMAAHTDLWVRVRDPMKNSDVVSYWNFDIEKVTVSLAEDEGRASMLSGDEYSEKTVSPF